MMLLGRIEKAEHGLWRAECAWVGAYTQGKSRQDAREMLADCIEVLVGRDGFQVTAAEIAEDPGPDGADGYVIGIDANDLAALLAEVLKHQRRLHKLTLVEVAERLGSKNVNAYAAYERGEREPSISKYRAMLAAVAPEMTLFVGARKPAKSATTTKGTRAAKRSKTSRR